MKKILIIGGDAVIADQISKALAQADYSVSTAKNVCNGLELALTYSPDCIICDPILPGQDGFGVLQLMQNNKQLRSVPFIFLALKIQIREDCQTISTDDKNIPYKKEDLIQVIEDLIVSSEHQVHSASEHASFRNSISVAFADTLNSGQHLFKMIERIADPVIIKKKHIIYMDGNKANHLYYIKKGKVKAFKNNEEGKELIVGIYGEGDFLGHVALLADSVHSHSAKAMDNSELLVISKSEFDSIVFHNPHIIKHFISLLVKGLNEKESQLLNVAYNSLRQKVADTLLVVNEKYKNGSITLSRENLAAIAGTATASFIRALSELKDKNIIEITRNNITILSTNKLKQVVG